MTPISLISWAAGITTFYAVAVGLIAIVMGIESLIGVYSEGVAVVISLLGCLPLTAWIIKWYSETLNWRLSPKWQLSTKRDNPEWLAWRSGWRLWLQRIAILLVLGTLSYWLLDWSHAFDVRPEIKAWLKGLLSK